MCFSMLFPQSVVQGVQPDQTGLLLEDLLRSQPVLRLLKCVQETKNLF